MADIASHLLLVPVISIHWTRLFHVRDCVDWN